MLINCTATTQVPPWHGHIFQRTHTVACLLSKILKNTVHKPVRSHMLNHCWYSKPYYMYLGLACSPRTISTFTKIYVFLTLQCLRSSISLFFNSCTLLCFVFCPWCCSSYSLICVLDIPCIVLYVRVVFCTLFFIVSILLFSIFFTICF